MFEIKSRWTGQALFACELSAEVAGKSYGFQLGFAVRQAYSAGAVLRGAVLRGADLSDADLSGAVLSDADLSDAVLRGAVLRDADLRGAVLLDAVLSDADLSDADLRGAVLRDADLRGAVLRDAVLSDADLSDAVLRGAVLRDADLSGADLRECPVKIPNIHRAVYEAASQPGALNMKTWHTCGTTHCRAGWVVHLAGQGGAALEWALGTPAAAALIYQASDPQLARIPDFYCDNDAALADMKRLAGAAA
jgi:uncharacterized protein YjbI with pentapeptide repeats